MIKNNGLMSLVGVIATWSLLFVVAAFGITMFVLQSPAGTQEDRLFVAIDRLIAGQEVKIEDLRPILNVGIYPMVQEWAAIRGVPKDRLDEVVKTISIAFREAAVKIDLPEDIRAFALPAASPK